MPGAPDAELVVHLALLKGAARVGALGCDGVDGAGVAVEEDAVCAGLDEHRRVGLQIALAGHPGPVGGRLIEDGVVDTDAAREHEVAADVPAGAQYAQTGRAEEAGDRLIANAAAQQGREIQRRSSDVGQRVDHVEAAFGLDRVGLVGKSRSAKWPSADLEATSEELPQTVGSAIASDGAATLVPSAVS